MVVVVVMITTSSNREVTRMITRQRAIEIIQEHGFALPNDQSNFIVHDTLAAFDAEVGNKPKYKLMEVLGWLGYCCPFC